MADKKTILLRIPPDLWENLNAWAKDELRSLNAQIEYTLREAVRKRGRKLTSPEPARETEDQLKSNETLESKQE
jgi:hypothetical protein